MGGERYGGLGEVLARLAGVARCGKVCVCDLGECGRNVVGVSDCRFLRVNGSSRATGPGALDGIGGCHVVVATALFNAFDLAKDGGAVCRQILFCDGLESENASFWWDSEDVCHEGLDQGRIALVGDGL